VVPRVAEHADAAAQAREHAARRLVPLQREVAEVIDDILVADARVPVFDQRGVHLGRVCEWALAVADDVGVSDVSV